jgi:hypothetical protein
MISLAGRPAHERLRLRARLAVSLLAACAAGCDPSKPDVAPASAPAPIPQAGPTGEVRFVEVARDVGIDFVHGNGAFGLKWLPETMGSGCAFVDVDGDGDSDVLLLSGTDWPGHPTAGRDTSALYRNDGGRFTDVTAKAGLDAPFFAMGVAAGDMDADGDEDLYITAMGPNRLYRNDAGHFVDVAARMGVNDPGFSSSAAWFDPDRDGDLDLVSLDYVDWTPETDLNCSLDGVTKSYCTPESYKGASPRLFRNDGVRFVDVAHQRGFDASTKGLGVVIADFDGDRRDDVFIANDTEPNALLHQESDGSFTNVAVLAGVAFDDAGHARGAMGVDVGDWQHSGRPGLVIGNFSNEMVSLYENEGNGSFRDRAPESGVGPASLRTLAFGTFFFDYDLDGFLDIFVANGHLEKDIQSIQSELQYAQPPHLFRNLGGGRFEDVAPLCPALSEPMVARGAAFGDFDGDLDLDILVNTVGDRARLFRNDSADGHRALRVRLEGGAGSNRDGFGAEVRVRAGGLEQVAWPHSGGSYASQSEAVLTFGLGTAKAADELTVLWPSGKRSVLAGVPAGTSITVREAEAR